MWIPAQPSAEAAQLLARGDQLRADGQWAEAAECYQRSQLPSGMLRLGEMLEQQGQLAEALQAFQTASRMEPWTGEFPLRIGNLLTSMNQTAAAERQYRQAAAVDPSCFAAWAMLGQSYANQGRLEEAEFYYGRALAVRPDPKVKIVLATLLPPIYDRLEDVASWQQRLWRQLEQLHEQGVHVDPTREAIPNLFLLAYQGGNVREIQRLFATLFQPPPEALECHPVPSEDGRIRVGMLSEYFCNHTIGTLNRNLVRHLDRRRFHLTVISAARSDDETARAYREGADRFVRLPSDTARAQAAVRELNLDLLFFTDLGMSCLSLPLACTRLAPVQCVTWGHPLTTGMPTMDYFLSGQLYEVPEADSHYTEQLVRMPGLQTCYPRPELPTQRRTRGDFGLPEDAHLYGCPQTLFKFHPDFDPLLAEILRRDPRGRLVMIEGKHPLWETKLRARWQQSMPDVVDRVQFLPTLPRGDFVSLCGVCDVLLDPLQFGGGNTTLEAMAVGTPVVTWPTPFLRSRLAQGMFRHMGWTDGIVGSAAEYVDRAVQWGSEPDARQAATRAIRETAGSLFDNVASVRAFEAFFAEAHEKACSARR